MLKSRLLFSFFLFYNVICAQVSIEEPVIMPVEMQVYVAPFGNNMSSGDSLHPVADFVTAMQVIKDSTASKTGDVYAEVVFYPGTYAFVLNQGLGHYQVGNRLLNISIRGKEKVIFDERLIPGSSATAMVYLLGSHISVRNIKIAYCEGHGTLFGYHWGGTTIVPHDILVQNVVLEGSGSHGLFAGLGRFANSQHTSTLPWLERVMFDNCTVTNSVNHNDMNQTAWGSAIKFHYVKHGIIRNCLSYNNAGEGINLDDCNTILIEGSESHDNRASVYFDKAENVVFRNNLMYSTFRPSIGLLLSTEVSSSLITNYYLRNIYVYNNIFLNVPCGIGYWMGTVSAFQNSILHNLQMCNNTFVGKRVAGTGILNFAYERNPFNSNAPAGNVQMSSLLWQGNIVSFSDDSLGKVITTPINPQPSLSFQNNLYHAIPNNHFNNAKDSVRTLMTNWGITDSLQNLIPSINREKHFMLEVPIPDYLTTDFFGRLRRIDTSNVGAIEMEIAPYVFAEESQFGCDSLEIENSEKVYQSMILQDTVKGYFQDTIVTKNYEVYASYSSTDSLEGCFYMVWQGDSIYSDTLLVDSLNTKQGCDSILQYYFNVHTTSAQIYAQNDSLFVSFVGDSVQWKECNSGKVWTDSLGFVAEEGFYKAISWNKGCADSTSCYEISIPTVISEKQNQHCPKVIEGRLKIEEQSGSWVLMNLQGQVVNKNSELDDIIKQNHHIHKGVYLLMNKELPECGVMKIDLN